MITISTQRGLYLSAQNNRFPKIQQIAALRLLMAERQGRAAGLSSLPAAQRITRVPVVGRCPMVRP